MGANRGGLLIALGAFVAASSGCATREHIILLPEPDGGPASLVVTQGERTVLLDRPYSATALSIADPWRYRATPEDVQSTFGAALAAQPARAAHYTLYFSEASDELTPDSQHVLEAMLADAAKRAIADILVVGHTDAVGTDQYNDALAMKRADAVKAMLIVHGIAQSAIVAIGRGKREMLVPTANGVAEPRNRRVEIVVR